MRLLALILFCWCSRLLALDREWFTILAEVESSSGKRLVGDDGLSRGWFQMQKSVWQETSERRRKAGHKVISWLEGSSSYEWSLAYAKTHALYLQQTLRTRLGFCSDALVYAAWNAGLTRVVQAEGCLKRLPKRTQENARRFNGQIILVASK